MLLERHPPRRHSQQNCCAGLGLTSEALGISAARKRTRPAHIVEELREDEAEDIAAEEEELRQRLNETEDVNEQVEILAFMRARGMSPAGRGAAGRFQRAPGGRGHGAVEKPRMAPLDVRQLSARFLPEAAQT